MDNGAGPYTAGRHGQGSILSAKTAAFFDTIGKQKTPTIADIAVRCNVSKATVSRVLHSPHLVKAPTRALVENALRESGYIYNAAAGDLARRGNSFVGLIVAGLEDASFGDIVRSLQSMTMEHDMLIGDTTYSPFVEARLLQRMTERRAAGVVMISHCIGAEPAIREAQAKGTPVLLLWNLPEAEDLNFIAFDNSLAVSQAADHLIELGHRRIGLVVGPYDRLLGARQRVDGLKVSLKKHGLPMDYRYVIMADSGFTPEAGRLAMTRLLEISPRPTAIILAGDILGVGAYAAVRQAGLRIPTDISLITLDDIDFAPHMDPPLTTVHLPTHEMGRLAGQYLAKVLNGEQDVCRICLPTSLMPRGSTAEPPHGD